MVGRNSLGLIIVIFELDTCLLLTGAQETDGQLEDHRIQELPIEDFNNEFSLKSIMTIRSTRTARHKIR